MAAFSDSHCAGHQFWYLHDRLHPRHDPSLAGQLEDPIRDIYIALDRAIGKIIECTGPETNVFIVSSHGMGPHYDCSNFLDTMLRRMEGEEAQTTVGAKAANQLDHLWKKIPDDARQSLMPLRSLLRRPIREKLVAPDRARRKCFVIPNNLNYGAIRINLAGREPRGIVRPGYEYERFCDELIRNLEDWLDIETWKPVVRRVLRTDELFPGKYRDDLPDLLVEWDNRKQVTCMVSPRFGRIDRNYTGNRTGDHKNPGICFIRGPGIASGHLAYPVSGLDYAPTIASLLGTKLDNIDGRIIDTLKCTDMIEKARA